MRAAHTGPVTGLVAQMLLLAALAGSVAVSGVGLGAAGWIAGVTCGVVGNAALARGLSIYRSDRLSPADWVTLARATLVIGVAALVADSFGEPPRSALMVSLAGLALVLDAVDGWVARRTRTSAGLGAQFDAEVDAFLILVLSVYVARFAGDWVLAIGAARYVFLAAGWSLPWMCAPLPPRFWRKVVAATQGIVLAVAAARVLPPGVTQAAGLAALVLLAESFGHDVWWLRTNRPARRRSVPGGVQPSSGPDVDPPPGPRRGRGPMRRSVSGTLTILAAIVLWAALVAPDQPKHVTLSGFLRLPLEGLVLIAVALVLPVTARRVLAAVAGPLLALVVIFKVLDIGFLTTFDRRFDLLSDSSYARTGIETLRAAIGRTEANLAVAAIVIGVILLFIVTTFAAFRLTAAAAVHRRGALRLLGGLGAVWALCWMVGAQLTTHTPIASTLSAGLVVDEVSAVQADLHDQAVFANQIKHDAFRNTPANRLLTGLHGKDVMLVFVEAYGQFAVQGSSFSPTVDTVLSTGTRALAADGFSARSGFLTSATFGGISWLAHSTLQSGVWVNSQRRYNDLMPTNRFTLSDAFRKAGWRTVDDVPSNDYYWPEGTSFYHYDKLYDRRNVGYHGPTFTYASMPDQYTYAALQRLELSKTHRKPLFAEVDTVSSHMPWNRIPAQIPWGEVGDGSIYNRIPLDHETGAFWSNPARVQAAYGRSIVYSLNTLFSFVKHAADRNLVMIVLGDHQPLPIVSGQRANHDVPISIIAHDPKVLKQIGSWGWNPGLRPSPNAPVWPMSAFRDKFLAAFDARPAIK
ncbi:MAG: CDP-alcohol phosphatidyltransferase family protein [Solirubrobacteraceae bacterium]